MLLQDVDQRFDLGKGQLGVEWRGIGRSSSRETQEVCGKLGVKFTPRDDWEM